eukprot:5052226-Alexandrium_andersonii.AAC.1
MFPRAEPGLRPDSAGTSRLRSKLRAYILPAASFSSFCFRPRSKGRQRRIEPLDTCNSVVGKKLTSHAP